MKSIALLSVLLVAVSGNPILVRSFVPIRSFNHDIRDTSYTFSADSTDGSQSESGTLILPAGFKEPGASKTGQFSYTSPEGKLITLNYVADENGFRAVGDHLPVGPPMPEEIRAMLPTLPKLVELPEAPVTFVRSNPILIREAPSPVFISSPQRVLLQEPAPEKMLVRTPEFLIDSDNSKTIVRIGN